MDLALILIFYCYVTNYHTCSDLKQYPCVSSQFCNSAVWVWLTCALFSGLRTRTVSRADFSSGALESSSKVTVLGGSRPPFLAGCWGLFSPLRDHFQVLAMCPCPSSKQASENFPYVRSVSCFKHSPFYGHTDEVRLGQLWHIIWPK